jgi:putative ABC transport system permease protein
VAAASFALLTAAASTSQLEARGAVTRNFRPTYDILVRPHGSRTPLERQRALVRPNYLSGIFGGITMQQYRKIEGLQGVEVAAPIANVGYVLLISDVGIPVSKYLSPARQQLLRLRSDWVVDGGTSDVPIGIQYVYYTRNSITFPTSQYDHTFREHLPNGRVITPCSAYQNGRGGFGSPYAPLRNMDCFAAGRPTSDRGNPIPLRGHKPGVVVEFYFPLLVAAIDPRAEAALDGLRGAVTRGRYLSVADRPRVDDQGTVSVPMLAGSSTFVTATLHTTVQRVATPVGGFASIMDTKPKQGYGRTNRLPRHDVGTLRESVDPIYQQLLNKPSYQYGLGAYWQTGRTQYVRSRHGALRPATTPPDPTDWSDASGVSAPPGSDDTQFRTLHVRLGSNQANAPLIVPRIVGRFDPSKIAGFADPNQATLSNFQAPQLTAGDSAAAAALHGAPLRPDFNLGGYISQPPLLLTTLAALPAFENPHAYSNGQTKAPISVIRVRVAGVTGTDALSRARINQVATEIQHATHLTVDITTGSSPAPQKVELPAGKYGRPELTVNEQWTKKGVAVVILRAVDRKSAALFALVLIVCAFFLANASFAAVRTRRQEIGTLRALGWSQAQVFRLILYELFAVGLTAGALGAGLAAALAAGLDLDFPLIRAWLVIPVAVLLAMIAGIVPAWSASLAQPISAVQPAALARQRAGPVRGLNRMALRNLVRLPGRTSLGLIGLLVGVAALTMLLAVTVAFRGQVAGTVLGNVVTVHVRNVDYAAAIMAIVLGAFSVADVITLNLRERAAELATLLATGWGRGEITRLALVEGLAMAIIGSSLGVIAGLALATRLGGATAADLALTAAVAGLGGVAVVLIALVAPIVRAGRTPPALVLAEE